MATLAQTLKNMEAALMDDGRISLGETSILLRAVRPYVLSGDPQAIELEDLLKRVRADGVVTHEESILLCQTLNRLVNGQKTLEHYVRMIPDFPKPGVLFRDVTGILDTAEGFGLALDEIARALSGCEYDVVAAPESRGFIFGAAIAGRFGKAFVPIRKPGKLPRATIHESYELEYGRAELHMHADAIIPGERVVVVDDLLATGGTAAAAARLVERLGGKVVKMVFPIELEGFGARSGLLRNYDLVTLVKYPGR